MIVFRLQSGRRAEYIQALKGDGSCSVNGAGSKSSAVSRGGENVFPLCCRSTGAWVRPWGARMNLGGLEWFSSTTTSVLGGREARKHARMRRNVGVEVFCFGRISRFGGECVL